MYRFGGWDPFGGHAAIRLFHYIGKTCHILLHASLIQRGVLH